LAIGGDKHVFGIFWIVLFVVLAVWGWSFLKKEKGLGFGNTRESALDILKQRYAKAEIGKEEFNEKKRDLGL
jgi:putative membrane protein